MTYRHDAEVEGHSARELAGQANFYDLPVTSLMSVPGAPEELKKMQVWPTVEGFRWGGDRWRLAGC